MTNHFNHSPTVGSLDSKASYTEQQERIHLLEQRLAIAEAQLTSQKAEAKPKKKWWKAAGKFFRRVFKPILDFLPKFLNSIANLKSASRKAKLA